MPDLTPPREPAAGEPFAEVLAEWIKKRRREHVALGHTPTSVLGYCAEDDGISAAWCDEGIWLRAAALSAPATTETTPDEEYRTIGGVAGNRPPPPPPPDRS